MSSRMSIDSEGNIIIWKNEIVVYNGHFIKLPNNVKEQLKITLKTLYESLKD